MSQKIFRVHLELIVDNISCPGVRLDSYGHLQFIVNAMDSIARSNHYAPYFPILANEKFLFEQDFYDQKQLSDIQYSLGKQFLFIELVQLQNCKTNLLAMFKSTLLDLLYPAFKDKDLCARSQLDLIMIPFKSFPGVLGPKIGIFTKFRIETVCVPLCHSSRNSDHATSYKTNAINVYSHNSETTKSQKNNHCCEKL